MVVDFPNHSIWEKAWTSCRVMKGRLCEKQYMQIEVNEEEQQNTLQVLIYEVLALIPNEHHHTNDEVQLLNLQWNSEHYAESHYQKRLLQRMY